MTSFEKSYIKHLLLIGYSQKFRSALITYFNHVLPDARIDEYDLKDGCPGTEYRWRKYQLLIIDYDLGNGENGLDWIRASSASNDFPAVIMLTDTSSENIIVQAFRFGVNDFLRKDELTKDILFESVIRAVEKHKKDQVKADTITLSAHIYNKSRFLKKLEQAHKNDVVMVVELDDYQAIHDEHGIIITEKVCSHISKVSAEILKSKSIEGVVIRSGDAACSILIEGRKDFSIGDTFATQLCNNLNCDFNFDTEHPVSYTISIGMAIINDDGFDPETVFITADVACRIARNTEGNSYIVYGEASNEDKEEKSDRLQLDNVFIKDKVKPFFQHIIKISNSESLFRKDMLYTARVNLLGKDNNKISADQFMPVLKETNKLNTLDRWVTRYCISKLTEEYSNNNINTGLFMTLTSSSFSDKNLFKWIAKLIDTTDFPDIGNSLTIEYDIEKFLTFRSESEYLIKNLREEYGISAALIHIPNPSIFEKCMKHINFEFSRFSPCFDDIKMDTAEIKQMVSIAREYNSLSIADKLETGESLAAAIDAGVDYVSGYIIQPPQEKLETAESMEI